MEERENINGKNKKQLSYFSTTRLVALGFLLIIIVGTILLMLPIASASGTMTPLVDALFTTVTSVCVTGLVTVTTATHWSLFGHVVILILIQLGGLGVICCGIAFVMLLKRKIGLRERIMIQESYGLDNQFGSGDMEHGVRRGLTGYDGLIKRIIRGTFIIEAIGAVGYAIRFVPDFGWGKGVWYSVFHSVSAFCNAGLDIIGETSLMPYKTDIVVNLTTIFLIVTGGIGFVVWWDVLGAVRNAWRNKKYKNMIFRKLSLHSKLAITTTLILIIGGAALIFAFEYNNPATMGDEAIGGKVLMSFFQSVTTRTAGFLTILQENMTDAAYLITLGLMFIGGSPMGTAGGVKTTTIAMVVVCIISVIRGKKDIEAFDRKISSDNVRTGLTVIGISVMALLMAIILLTIIEPFSLKTIVFECVSAIATVGLGAGMTPYLSAAGKLVLAALMYIGRIGPITMAMAFSAKRSATMDGIELAEKKIIIG